MPPHKIRQEWLTLDEMTLAQIQYSAKSEIFVFLTLAETSRYKPPPSAILLGFVLLVFAVSTCLALSFIWGHISNRS